MKRLVLILTAALAAQAQALSIDEIMRRVAANQAKSVEARKEFVYRQQELVSIQTSSRKPTCEKRQEYAITPTPNGIDRRPAGDAENIKGRCQVNISTDSGPHLSIGMGSDGGDSLNMSLGNTKDGLPRGLFPLTTEEQALYLYKLAGTEMHDGHQAYRVTFRPGNKKGADGSRAYAKGTVWIDAAEFQPIEVKSDLWLGLPFGVRILLGTNVHGKGFDLKYQRLAEGVWFPSAFGGEFSVRALFFFAREISVTTTNSDFRHTDVASTVTYTGK